VLSSLKRCPAAGATRIEYACRIKYAWQVRTCFAESFVIAGSNDSPSNKCEAFRLNCVGGKAVFLEAVKKDGCAITVSVPPREIVFSRVTAAGMV